MHLSLGQIKEGTARAIHSVCWRLVGMLQVFPFRHFETRAIHSVIIIWDKVLCKPGWSPTGYVAECDLEVLTRFSCLCLLSLEIINVATVLIFKVVFFFIFICMGVIFACLCLVTLETGRGCQIPWTRSYRQLWTAMQVLGTEPWSPARTAKALNHWAISQVPNTHTHTPVL